MAARDRPITISMGAGCTVVENENFTVKWSRPGKQCFGGFNRRKRRKQLVPLGLAGSRPLGDHGRRFAPGRRYAPIGSRFAAGNPLRGAGDTAPHPLAATPAHSRDTLMPPVAVAFRSCNRYSTSTATVAPVFLTAATILDHTLF